MREESKLGLVICMIFGVLFFFTFLFVVATLYEAQAINSKLEDIKLGLTNLNKSMENMIEVPVTVTAYSPTVDQTDNTPMITASNEKVGEGIVALSRDLEKRLDISFGDVVYLSKIGKFEFQDRMHRRWKNRVDIFMWDREKAKEFGVRESVLIYKKEVKIGSTIR